jgi:hypothetical protein
MVHQDELEAELAYNFSRVAPDVVGNEYMVLGTIEKKMWQEGLNGKSRPLVEMLKYVADFKKYYDLGYEPGGWYPDDEDKITIHNAFPDRSFKP